METNRENKDANSQEGLSNSQKLSIIVLVVFAFLVILLWMSQFKKSISNPFYIPQQENNEENTDTCQGIDCLQESLDLKVRDTDQDGLSDWEELNLYNTSPYISDSDSDGFTDKEEIESNSDPNCPKGSNCNLENNTSLDTTIEDKTLNTEQTYEDIDTESELSNILNGGANVDVLRELLKTAGVDENLLDQMSDEMIMKSYEEVLENKE